MDKCCNLWIFCATETFFAKTVDKRKFCGIIDNAEGQQQHRDRAKGRQRPRPDARNRRSRSGRSRASNRSWKHQNAFNAAKHAVHPRWRRTHVRPWIRPRCWHEPVGRLRHGAGREDRAGDRNVLFPQCNAGKTVVKKRTAAVRFLYLPVDLLIQCFIFFKGNFPLRLPERIQLLKRFGITQQRFYLLICKGIGVHFIGLSQIHLCKKRF